MRIITSMLCICLTFSGAIFAATDSKKVLISQVIEHPALNATTQGIIDGLAGNGYKQGENLELRVESAQGNSALAAQIANKFVHQKPDIVVGVGTVSAQSFVKFAITGKVKLVFSSVTDPRAANLTRANDSAMPNITGVSNFVELKPQLELFMILQPQLRRLGILYNPGEINSASIVQQLEDVCKEYQITLVKQSVMRVNEIPQAATKLADNCDAIFISNDNTVLGALQSVIKAANNKNIPVYVSDTDAVALGSLAAFGPNQYKIGLQTGRMIAQILDGKDINQVPVEFPEQNDLYINLDAAQALQIQVQPVVLKAATKVIASNKS